MKMTCLQIQKYIVALGAGLLLAGSLTAQTFKTLHSFTSFPCGFCDEINIDGADPLAGLILSNDTLYGTAASGGTLGGGTLFAINIDGSGFQILRDFTDLGNGMTPDTSLFLSDNTLYGVTQYGGSSADGTVGSGTVFAINTDGTGFSVLHNFSATYTNGFGNYTNDDGAAPQGELILSGNTLYGTTSVGGSSGNGTVFAMNINGTEFTTLHNFTPITGGGPGILSTNSDGANPFAALALWDTTLYGTAYEGGSSGTGTVFALNTDGSGFKTLHGFGAIPSSSPFTNSDGAWPDGKVVVSGNTLFGATQSGGTSGNGALFRVNIDGSGFAVLHSFTAFHDDGFGLTNADGCSPQDGLLLLDNMLYGAAFQGGSSGSGTLFAVNTNGAGFTTLYNFTGTGDGAGPNAGLIIFGNMIYGTTEYCDTSGNGTVFSISFPPQLTLILSGPNSILTWPTNFAGFDYSGYNLQSTTNLASPVWTANSLTPAVVNSQYTVTNSISGTQQFYRLVLSP